MIDKSIDACEIARKRLPSLFKVDITCTSRVPVRNDMGKDESDARYVYIIKDKKEPGWLKVGIAKNPKLRLESLRTGRVNRKDLQLVYTVKTSRYRELEKHLHEAFNSYYEWVESDVESVRQEAERFLEAGYSNI